MITTVEYYNYNLLSIAHGLVHVCYLHTVHISFVIPDIASLVHFSLTSHLSHTFCIGVILNTKSPSLSLPADPMVDV